MTRKKKTRFGAEVRSIRLTKMRNKPIWWLALIEKGSVQIYEYVWKRRALSKIFQTSNRHFKEETFLRLRDSPGRSFDSFSWSRGGHGTSHSRHSYASKTTLKDKTSQDILKAGSDYLKQASKEKRFDCLAIFASPRTRGSFKKGMGAKILRKIEVEKKKPASYLTSEEVEKELISQIPLETTEPPRFFPRAQGIHLMRRFTPLERREP